MKEQVLYAVKKGEPDWKEVIITNNPKHFDEAKEYFQNEYDRFRIATIDLSTPPDFTKTIR